jgi:hypothetical protein
MTILFDATRLVKSRHAFGTGILPAATPRPTFRPTAEDRAWWARECDRSEHERRRERRACESAALDHVSRGLIPPDRAEALMAISLVGHDDRRALA